MKTKGICRKSELQFELENWKTVLTSLKNSDYLFNYGEGFSKSLECFKLHKGNKMFV